MPTSPRKALRIKPDLLKKIEASQGKTRFTDWATRAFQTYLEGERGLGQEFRETLLDTNRQLIALGRNLNQIAHAANAGQPVRLNQGLVKNLRTEIIRSKALVEQLLAKLP